MNKIVDIVTFENELSIEHLRADGFIAYKYQNKGYISFIEVEISNKDLDLTKYKKLLTTGKYRGHFPTFPKLIAITNKKIQDVREFEVVQIKEDLSNIKDIFERGAVMKT